MPLAFVLVGAGQNFPFGGTSILIIVGVGLDTEKKIESQLQQRNYEDKNGNKRTAFEIVAEEVSFCGSKAETGTGARQNEQPARVQPAASFATGGTDDFEEIPISDDLPF